MNVKHVDRKTAEAAVELTSGRLRTPTEAYRGDDFDRDVIHVLAIHLRKLGQEELCDQVEDILIGHANPAPVICEEVAE